jgi:divalent metal cation (Fe/Co/Zn/Cd) transporter
LERPRDRLSRLRGDLGTLARFALDSLIEIFASVVVVWRLKGIADREREHHAVRLIGLAFLALAAYIGAQAVVTIVLGIRPDTSPLGIVWLTATCFVMLALAVGKLRTGTRLGSEVLTTEAKVTMVDGALAGAILVGLILNATLGWWWADIAAGGVIVGYGLHEGIHALRSCGGTRPPRGRHQHGISGAE